jgi:glycosyltransferase involved in cell wall biosynthesis
MGRNGWEAVRTMFNWDVEAAKLLSLYRTLIPGVVG